MKQETIFTVMSIIVMIIIVAILVNNRMSMAAIVKPFQTAEEKTRFKPTFFLIYDRSTPDICDRLIIVQPFGWIIWAINNDVYILDNIIANVCPLGSSVAIRVTNDIMTFNATCMNVVPLSLINLYKDPQRIDYDIQESAHENKFTVLDALNILFKKYITIQFDKQESTGQLNIANFSETLLSDNAYYNTSGAGDIDISKTNLNEEENSHIKFQNKSKQYQRFAPYKKKTLNQLFYRLSATATH